MASAGGSHPSVVRLVLVLLGACLVPLGVRGIVVPATSGPQLEAAGTAAERAALRGDDPVASSLTGSDTADGERPAGGSTADIPPMTSSTAPPTTQAGSTTSDPQPTTTTRPTTSAPTSTTTTAAPTVEEVQSARVLELVNEARARVSCDPLVVQPQLTTAAQLHSEDMSERDYMDHVTPEGLDPGDRATAQGFTDPVGENVAMGYPSAEAVVEAWMGSEGHRANIENCDYTTTGIGVDPDGWYWTQMFGLSSG